MFPIDGEGTPADTTGGAGWLVAAAGADGRTGAEDGEALGVTDATAEGDTTGAGAAEGVGVTDTTGDGETRLTGDTDGSDAFAIATPAITAAAATSTDPPPTAAHPNRFTPSS